MTSSDMDWNKEKPLGKVTCSSYDCERDLHSFRRRRPGSESYRNEDCVACGAQLIDWHRLDRHDLKDVDNTFDSLRLEMIRHHFWHKKIDKGALNHALGKGVIGLRQAAEHRLNKYVGAPSSELFRDGTQTPQVGNVIFYAQHATATCCRKCIEAWHGINREVPLVSEQIGYMTELIMKYIQVRLPELPPTGPKMKHGQLSMGYMG